MFDQTLIFLMPFANEIANALTISKEPGFERIYVPCTHNWKELEIKTLIDVIALTGILWNVSLISAIHGVNAGLAKGFMLIVVAWIIPNVFMENFVELICGTKQDEETKCSHHVKLFTGIVFVMILLTCEYLLSYLLGKVSWKKKRN